MVKEQICQPIAEADGYSFTIDTRWSGDRHFLGPVVLMLYGAYGLDIDLDADPDLGLWLERGFAVATAHVRGGGPEARLEEGLGRLSTLLRSGSI